MKLFKRLNKHNLVTNKIRKNNILFLETISCFLLFFRFFLINKLFKKRKICFYNFLFRILNLMFSQMLLLYLVIHIFKFAMSCGTLSVKSDNQISTMNFLIEKTWNSEPISHDPIKITLESDKSEPEILTIKIRAPYYANPAKSDKYPGEFFNLWDYEGIFHSNENII
jgi:hypothetical protein